MLKTIFDPHGLLRSRLTGLRDRFRLEDQFPGNVLAEAERMARHVPGPTTHRDRTDENFVTLDPASATDLDQAFHVEMAGRDILLHYAIADVGFFVMPESALEKEAWQRGMTIYLPGNKVRLYPPALSEGAASLLPDGPRPAVVFTVRVDPDGQTMIDGIERTVIRSRAKLAYVSVTDGALPSAAVELARRIETAERERGAARVDPPEQELEILSNGRVALQFRPPRRSEDINACLSMACNLAVARLFVDRGSGLFRVMEEPDIKIIAELRQQSAALHLAWPAEESLQSFERRLDPADTTQAAMMMAIRRAGNGAGYAAYREQPKPWHAAIAAPYVHATAPLRRLADRYVVEAALALAKGDTISSHDSEAFARLPSVMARAGNLASQVERAALDLAQAAVLTGRQGSILQGRIIHTGYKHARVQLSDAPVLLNVPGLTGSLGDDVALVLTRVDADSGQIEAMPA